MRANPVSSLDDLVAGFRRFRQRYFRDDRSLYERLTHQGQTPKAMIVACCDARVDPAIVMDCDPGDLFVVRNVANLVPPCEEGRGYHGTSAALEFAVRCLRVEHVIVMGHARCGGIQALLGDIGGGEFITPWMSIAAAARREAAAMSVEHRVAACEQAAVRISLDNLMTFPFVREAVAAGRLRLHGWYFDLDGGALRGYDPAARRFVSLVEGARPAVSN